MTSPVVEEAITWLAVPVIEFTEPVLPVALKVIEPPKETLPPPDNPLPALMVTDELAKSEFDIVPSLICSLVIELLVILTAPLVTVKNDDEKEAIPKVVFVAVPTLRLEEMVGLCGSPVTVMLLPGMIV